jgi:hypothetical protein
VRRRSLARISSDAGAALHQLQPSFAPVDCNDLQLSLLPFIYDGRPSRASDRPAEFVARNRFWVVFFVV